MKVLLDTHAFLWWVEDSAKLSKPARAAIAKHEAFVSLVSAWELAIKTCLKKIALSRPAARYFEIHSAACGFDVLGIELGHIAVVETLPFHHGDPFDRLLIAQARTDGFAIVSSDDRFDEYGVKRIW